MANPKIKPVELCLHPPGGYREIHNVVDGRASASRALA
jgi:hypothetical protein